MQKQTVELVRNRKSLGFFNRHFLVPKPNNKLRSILNLSTLIKFLKTEKFKMKTPESIRTYLQTGKWVTSIDFKDVYFHIPIHTIQEVPVFSSLRSIIPIQITTILSVLSPHVILSSGLDQTYGSTQGYKSPPVARLMFFLYFVYSLQYLHVLHGWSGPNPNKAIFIIHRP